MGLSEWEIREAIGGGIGGLRQEIRIARRCHSSPLGKQFRNCPNVIGDPCFHRGSHAKAGMNATEIVVSEVQGDSGFQIQQFLSMRAYKSHEFSE